MAANFSFHNRMAEYDLAIERFPHAIHSRGSNFTGIFLIVFSSVWGGLPTFILISIFNKGEFKPFHFFFFIFTITGVLLFVYGVSQFFLKQSWQMTPTHIIHDKTGLFGTKHWMEPISKYRGILSSIERRSSGGKNNSTYPVYVLYLFHEDSNKSIKLFESRNNKYVRSKWEKYAQKFNLPAVEKIGKGYVERKVENLDKSAKDLIKSGGLKLDFNPKSNPPKGLTFVKAGAGLLLVQNRSKFMLFFQAIIMLIIPAVFIYIGFFAVKTSIVFGLVGILFAIIIVVGFIYESITKPCFDVNQSFIHVYRLTPWGQTKGVMFNANDIEAIEVKRTENNFDEVVISTDAKESSVTSGLSKEARHWLRDFMIYTISS